MKYSSPTKIKAVTGGGGHYTSVDSDSPKVEAPSAKPLIALNLKIPHAMQQSPESSPTAGEEEQNNLYPSPMKQTNYSNSNDLIDTEPTKIFIRFVGCPPPVLQTMADVDSPSKFDLKVSSPNGTTGIPLQNVSQKHNTIKDPNDATKELSIVDVFDAENEDPFTIETFADLAEMHAEQEKDFIIARVTTMDPNDVTKFYYSYYAAHHINKVLFRTQPEQGLLHRMKSKNPLNNMDIVGDVHYYIIKHQEIQTSPASSKPSSPILETIADSIKHIIASVSDVLHPHNHDHDDPSKKRSSEPSSPVLYFKGLIPTSRNNGGAHRLQIDKGNKTSRSAAHSPTKITTDVSIKERRNSEDDAFSEVKLIPPDIVLENPLHDIVSETRRESIHKKIRSRTFRNEHHRGSVNIEDWVLEQLNNDRALKLKNKGTKNFHCSSNKNKEVRKRPNSPVKKDVGDSVKIVVPPSPTTKLSHKYYTAEYYATDDDFLMKASVRTCFKKNALEQNDYILFTLNASGTSLEQPHPLLPHIGYSYHPDESSGRVNGPLYRALRKFAHSKWALYALLIYIGTSVGIIVAIENPNNKTVVGVLLMFILCVAIVVLI